MPRPSAKRRITAEDLYALQIVEDPQISPDGRHIAFVKASIDRVNNQYRRHIWLTSLDGRQPATRQFTYGPKADTSPRWSPDGQMLAFVSARGDKAQIHLISLAGGEARPLTKMRNGVANPVWSPDGRRVAFSSPVHAAERQREDAGREEQPPADSFEARQRRERDEHRDQQRQDPRVITRLPYRTGTEFFDDRAAHLYVVDVPGADDEAEPKPRRLTDGECAFAEIDWTHDGRYLITTLSRAPQHDPWFQADVVRIPVTPPGGRRRVTRLTRPGYEYWQPRVSPDGRWIAALRHTETSDFGVVDTLVIFPAGGATRATAPVRELSPALDRNIELLRWSSDSRFIYVQVSDHGNVGVCRIAANQRGRRGSAAISPVVCGQRTVTSFSVDRAGRLAFAAWTPERPADLCLADPANQSEACLTDFNRKLLAAVQLARPQEVRYPAPDGRPIQGWFFRPVGAQRGRRYPLAVHVHGGPHIMWGPSTPSMWLEWQLHAARGYAVFFCNPRGADGYGEEFADAIHNDWGDHVMHDILAGVDHVLARDFVDERRLALTGGSYAGYMAAWIVGHDRRFACAWAQRGLYNLLSFFGTTDIPQLIEREFDMLPFDDVHKAWQQSPLAYVRNIRTPLAIEHQDQDYRCPVSEAEQLYSALKRLKRTVVLYRYPREGHEMSRSGEPRHRVDRLNRMVAWFDRYCLTKR